MAEKREKEAFVVADKRKFTAEGELRPDAELVEESKAVKEAVLEPAPSPAEAAQKEEEMPPPPSAAEQAEQHSAYQAANKKIDGMLDEAGVRRPAANMEVTFERLVASMYMQAMMQLGLVREEGAPMRPDVIGARSTIDTLSLLGEKTKGNLTDKENSMLQNTLFELRMAFLEITNMLTQAPPPPGGGPARVK